MSPTGASILMTSAPMSAIIMVQKGPVITLLKSNTRTPESGPPMLFPPFHPAPVPSSPGLSNNNCRNGFHLVIRSVSGVLAACSASRPPLVSQRKRRYPYFDVFHCALGFLLPLGEGQDEGIGR